MTKDKNGITLVSLVITIIVMLIIFGVTITTGTKLLENSKKIKIQTNLYTVKSQAETLLEQYMFDGNVEPLISFSKLEKKGKSPTGYSIISNYFTYEKNLNGTRRPYTLNSESAFYNKIKDSVYKELWTNGSGKPKYSDSKDVTNQDGTTTRIPRFLFVKWGWDECVSKGICKENVNGKTDNDSIVNKDDYIIVLYDLFTGKVDVAYSKGYRSNGKIAYTLDSILNIDTIEE